MKERITMYNGALKPKLVSLEDVLEKTTVIASAPCRVDCGNTWDLKTLALPFERLQPVTVNIAINLRATVTLRPFKTGWIKVTSQDFGTQESPLETAPFNSKLGLFFAIACFFGVSGIHFDVRSEFPTQSGLGGSAAVTVAAIAAIAESLHHYKIHRMTHKNIVLLAHGLEESLRISLTGLQDQAAATYGGVNRWVWSYSSSKKPFTREPLLPSKYHQKLSQHLLLAYTGVSRSSSELTDKWVKQFLSGNNRTLWIRNLELTNELADALRLMDWKRAAMALTKEAELRRQLFGRALTPIMDSLISEAGRFRCGARFTGGGGGCVWALGTSKDIAKLKTHWMEILSKVSNARLLEPKIASKGVIQKTISRRTK